MDFETYYKGHFEADLRAFLGSIPEKHKRTLWNDPSALTIRAEHGVRPYLFRTEPKLADSPLYSVQIAYGYGLTP